MPCHMNFDTIGPIKLAYNRDEHFTERNAFVVGWGTNGMTSQDSTKLKYTTLPIINTNVCQQYWYVDERHVCTAAGLGRDSCQGDSGPLIVVDENGIDGQVGIVSYGNVRCPSDAPGVFTRISEYKHWIDQVVSR
ncbi:PREDICTED: chymotrypsin-like protease CTRL-1 [Vollenhovia emeryi]|uniref:chymotrypsin-like protease CTRL-1 n=1 Tax=Vollenhovia emeryi TaxID=411798 RepID=UPI0005F56C69|nr:PREDICTED: chymotrypsin-like protease CTRL-1 [Vollenhovia emeryi]